MIRWICVWYPMIRYFPVGDIRSMNGGGAAEGGGGCCGCQALTFVGTIANVLRMCVCVALFVCAIVIFMAACKIIISTELLFVVAVISLIGGVSVAFDGATSQWLVQKVLVKLSHSVAQFEADIKQFEIDLQTSANQIQLRNEQLAHQTTLIAQQAQQLAKHKQLITQHEHLLAQNEQLIAIQENEITTRDNQLREQGLLITKQNEQLANVKTIQSNMSVLLASLIQAQSNDADMNDVFRANLEMMQQQLKQLELLKMGLVHESFDAIDADHDHIVTETEFTQFIHSKK